MIKKECKEQQEKMLPDAVYLEAQQGASAVESRSWLRCVLRLCPKWQEQDLLQLSPQLRGLNILAFYFLSPFLSLIGLLTMDPVCHEIRETSLCDNEIANSGYP